MRSITSCRNIGLLASHPMILQGNAWHKLVWIRGYRKYCLTVSAPLYQFYYTNPLIIQLISVFFLMHLFNFSSFKNKSGSHLKIHESRLKMNLLQAYHRNTWNLTAVKELLIICKYMQVNCYKADTPFLVASNWVPVGKMQGSKKKKNWISAYLKGKHLNLSFCLPGASSFSPKDFVRGWLTWTLAYWASKF